VLAAPSALFDAPLGVTVTGAPVGRRVTVEAFAFAFAFDDGGRRPQSSATVVPGPSAGSTRPPPHRWLAATGAHDTRPLWS
jgi:hypothetical protein